MPEELLDLGPERYVLIVVTVGWVLALLLTAGLQLARRRPPAILLWLGPAAMLFVGGTASLYAQIRKSLQLEQLDLVGDARVDAELLGLISGFSPLIVALHATAIGCILSALFMAVAGIVRVGPDPRFTPLHAGGAAVALLCSTLGILAGPEVLVLAALAAVAQGIAALRVGGGRDRRRVASNRVLVASLGVAGMLCLTLARPLSHRLDAVRIWASAPVDAQEALLAGMVDPMPGLFAILGIAGVLVMTGFIGLLPVARSVVDARSGAGFVLSLLLMSTIAVGLYVPVLPLTEMVRPDPALDRRIALEAKGIVLPVHRPTAPWQSGTHATIGLYWAHVDGVRVVPFKDGRPDPEMDDDAFENRLRRGLGQVLIVEADHRTDAPRILPILRRAYAVGYDDACFVVQDTAGTMGCQRVRLGRATEADQHLLIHPDELIHVDEEAQSVTLGAVASLSGPLALHLHEELPGPALWTVLEQVDDPLLVVRP